MALVQTQDLRQLLGAAHGYWLTRFVILRLLGFIYAIAFLVAANQTRAANRLRRSSATRIISRSRARRARFFFGGLSPLAIRILDKSFRLVARHRRPGSASRCRALSLPVTPTRFCSRCSGFFTCRSFTSVRIGTATAGRCSCSKPDFSAFSCVRFSIRDHFLARRRRSSSSGFSAAHFPNHVRRRPDQNPRRRELAQSDRALLSLRNAADPKRTQPLVSFSSAGRVASSARSSITSPNWWRRGLSSGRASAATSPEL